MASGRRRLDYVRFAVAFAAIALYTPGVPTQSPAPVTYGVTALDPLGGQTAVAYDAAEYGQVLVGRARTATGAFHAFAQGYFGVRDIGTFGGAESTAFAVHGNLVVGQSQTASGQQRAFLADMNTNGVTNLGTLGGTWSAAYDVRSGHVVGAATAAGDARKHAFQFLNGTMSAIAIDRGGDSVAKGVNNLGDIVGYACTSANTSCRAFLVSNGLATELGPAGRNSTANGINDAQQIVGSFTTSSGATHAFLHLNGSMADLGTLGGANSEGLAVNERGEVVGTSQSSAGAGRAFVWRNGMMTDLNTLLPPDSGWVLESATSISDGGQIVGVGTVDGASRAFLLTPPTDLSLFIGGVRSLEDSNLPRGIEVGKTVRYVTSVEAHSNDGITMYGARVTHTLTGPAEFVDAQAFDNDSCEVTPTVVTCRIHSVDTIGIGRETWVRARTTGPGPVSHEVTVTSDAPDPNEANNSISEANRAIALSTFALTPDTLPGGKVSAARITLTEQAPAGDAVVRVTSSRPDIAPVPSTFVVPSWTNTRTFNIIPAVVSSATTVEISVTYGLVTVTRTLTVVPPKLAQLYLTPTTVIGGCGTSAGKMLLTGSAPAGGAIVPLSNSNTKATVPATVTVPPGKSSATFTVSTATVTTPSSGTVSASYGGVSQTLNLGVRPIRAQSVALTPNPARGGTTVSGTITLECPAAPGAVTVRLTSSNPALASPIVPTITIPAGATSANFAIRTSPVSGNSSVSIHVWVFDVRKSATLGIVP
jgi:probable HAF family extracellular repeat protein